MAMPSTPLFVKIMFICEGIRFFGLPLAVQSIEPPVIQPFIIPKSLRLGNRISFLCTVSQGDGPFTFKWYHNGKELHTSPNDGGSFLSTYLIDGIKATDIGNYTCLVSNAAGTDSYTTNLEVEAPPVWKNEPQDSIVVLGSSISFQCAAMGYPTPKVTWMKEKDGTGRDFMTVLPDSRRNTFENGTLVITEAAMEDGGYYKCEAQNGIQPDLSKMVKLLVKVPPRVVKGFHVESVRKGEAAILKCQAIGDQPVSITWKKGGKILVVEEMERLEIIQKETPTGATSELIIRQTERQDGGIFSCIAKNSVGDEEGKVELIIAEPPSSPLSVTVTDVSSQSVRLSWRSSVSSSDEPLVSYLVRYWKTAGGSKKLNEIEVLQQESNVLLKDLNPGTSYTAQVLAKNAVGLSEPSKPAGFRTHEEAPSASPTNIRAEAIGMREILLWWQTPPSDHWNGILKGYSIGHRKFDSSAPFSFKSISFAEYQSEEGVLVQGLDKDTKYSIVVKAYNSAGTGPHSHEIVVKTLAGEPPAAPIVSIPEISLSEARVTWYPFSQNYQPIIQYLLQYRKEGSEWNSLHIPSQRDHLLLNHLEQGKRYDFKMSAYNRYGRGNFSRVIAVTTDSGFSIGEPGPKEHTPLYLQSQLVVPVAASFVVIVTAIVMAWACYKKHLIQQQQAIESQIPPDQMYPYNRNSIAQSDGYCDISRIPLYLQQNGVIQSGTLERRIHEDTYDTPWDQGHDNANGRGNDGNYTRLKNTPHTSGVVSSRNK